jgi:hypothetical protein
MKYISLLILFLATVIDSRRKYKFSRNRNPFNPIKIETCKKINVGGKEQETPIQILTGTDLQIGIGKDVRARFIVVKNEITAKPGIYNTKTLYKFSVDLIMSLDLVVENSEKVISIKVKDKNDSLLIKVYFGSETEKIFAKFSYYFIKDIEKSGQTQNDFSKITNLILSLEIFFPNASSQIKSCNNYVLDKIKSLEDAMDVEYDNQDEMETWDPDYDEEMPEYENAVASNNNSSQTNTGITISNNTVNPTCDSLMNYLIKYN